MSDESYQVKLESFQGPLDLLLFLIRKKKIDIHDIPIAAITKDYLHYLDQKETIILEREAEFLLIASLLIYIKSQMLLPRETVPEEEDEDPRKALVNKLLDFQRIRAAGSLLREKEAEQLQKWQRSFPPPMEMEEDIELTEVALFDLAEAFFNLMKKRERENFTTIKRKEVSLEDKMEEMLEYLEKHGYLDFIEYFNRQETLSESFVAFFCLLELIKARIVVAVQESLFQRIKVWLRKENPS
ncbi:MAG: segregation/condensation protein A [Candidatus Aminicenantes bacterium]|jgi:segregation and condensation protein A